MFLGSLNDPNKDTSSSGDSTSNATPKYIGSEGIIKTTSGKDVTVISGQNLQIHCPTRGTLRPVLTWFKDNVAIQPSNRLIPRGEMLLLNEVSLETAGEYTCRMTTEIGTKATNTKVKILGEEKSVVYTKLYFLYAYLNFVSTVGLFLFLLLY